MSKSSLSNFHPDRRYVTTGLCPAGTGFVTRVTIKPRRDDDYRAVEVEILVPLDGCIQDILGPTPSPIGNPKRPEGFDDIPIGPANNSLQRNLRRMITFEDD